MGAYDQILGRVTDRFMADLLGVSVEQYQRRRTQNSPGQMSLFDDPATGSNLLRSSARQQSFDWDETKHPRAEDGKFTEAEKGVPKKAEVTEQESKIEPKQESPSPVQSAETNLDKKPVSFNRQLGMMSKKQAMMNLPEVGERFESKGKMYEITSVQPPRYLSRDAIEDFDEFDKKPGWHVGYTAKQVEKTAEENKKSETRLSMKKAADSVNEMASGRSKQFEGAENLSETGSAYMPKMDWTHSAKIKTPTGGDMGTILVSGDEAYYYHGGYYDDYRVTLLKQSDPEKVKEIKSRLESAREVLKSKKIQPQGVNYSIELSGSSLQPSREEIEQEKSEQERSRKAIEALEEAAKKRREEAAKNSPREEPREAKSGPTSATWARLKTGNWGARIVGTVSEGDRVRVTTKDGKNQWKTVKKIVQKGDGYSLAEVYQVDAAVDRAFDPVVDRFMAEALGLTVEQYERRRARNSPGQLSLWDDPATESNLLRTSARQKSFDWDESKVKRDPEGKFAEKAEPKKESEFKTATDFLSEGKSYGEYANYVSKLYTDEKIDEDQWNKMHAESPSVNDWSSAKGLIGRDVVGSFPHKKGAVVGKVTGFEINGGRILAVIDDGEGKQHKFDPEWVDDLYAKVSRHAKEGRVNAEYLSHPSLKKMVEGLADKVGQGNSVSKIIDEHFGEIPGSKRMELHKAIANAYTAKSEEQERKRAEPSAARKAAMEKAMARDSAKSRDGMVKMEQAPKGGAVSEVDGKFYKGGSWMPVHGAYSGQEKGPAKPPKAEGETPKASESKGPPMARETSPERAKEIREERERQAKWDQIKASPVGKLFFMGDRPHSLKRTDAGTRNWSDFIQDAGLSSESVKKLADLMQEKAESGISGDDLRNYRETSNSFLDDGAKYYTKKQLKSHPDTPRAAWYLSDHLRSSKSSGSQLDKLHELAKFVEEAKKAPKEPAATKTPRGFNFDNHVKIAADSIDKLRKSDVSRLVESTPDAETAQFVADEIGRRRPDLKSEADESIYDFMKEVGGKYSAVDAWVDRYMAQALGITVEQYERRRLKSSPGQMEFQWITVHPNGPGTVGHPVMISKKDGTIAAGMGGKFNGQKIGEIGRGGPGDSGPPAAVTPPEAPKKPASRMARPAKPTTEKQSEAEMPSPVAQQPAAGTIPQPAAGSPESVQSDAGRFGSFDPEKHGGYKAVLALSKDIDAGRLSLAELKAAHKLYADNHGAFVADLQKRYNAKELQNIASHFGDWRAKDQKKDKNAESIYAALMGYAFDIGKGISNVYSHDEVGGGVGIDTVKLARISALIDSQTEESLAAHVESRKESIQKREAEKAAEESAKLDPKTLEDFRKVLGERKYLDLTPEQRQKYDQLAADYTREQRKSKETQKAEVQEFKGEGKGVGFELSKNFHSKRGHDIFTASPTARVDADSYNEMNSAAKRLGGWYYKAFGGTPGGFHFPTEEARDKFLTLQSGNVDRSDELEAMKKDRQMGTAERLQDHADRLEERANETLGRDRLTNTSRRAGMAASIEGRAMADIAHAKTMRAISDGLKSGKLKYLDGVTQSTHLEELNAVARRAATESLKDELNKKYGKYDNAPHSERENLYTAPPITEKVADHAQYPYPSLMANELRKVAGLLKGKRNVSYERQVLESMANRSSDPNDVVKFGNNSWNAFKAAYDKIRQSGAIDRSSYEVKSLIQKMESTSSAMRRLKAAGIHNEHELRQALREYIPLKSAKAGADPVVKAERDLIGKKIEGFFPTPPSVIDRMMAKAELEPGHEVLEPSAGKGDIVDQIKRSQPEAKVKALELNRTFGDVLGAKGHDVEFSDFMEHRGQYDRILMNPPFEGGADMKHVRHAYQQLKPGGRLVAIMAHGGTDKRKEFDDWVESLGGEVEPLPEGSFSGSDAFRKTGVNTKMVTIEKPKSSQYSAADSLVDRFMAELFGLSVEQYAARKLKSSPGQQMFDWITVHPNGAGTKGVPVMIDKKDGTIKAGMGGKFDGMKIGEIGKKSGDEKAKPAREKPKTIQEADEKVASSKMLSEFNQQMIDEQKEEARKHKIGVWRKAFTGSPRENTTAGDLSRHDWEKAMQNGVEPERIAEIIDHGIASGVIDPKVGDHMKKKVLAGSDKATEPDDFSPKTYTPEDAAKHRESAIAKGLGRVKSMGHVQTGAQAEQQSQDAWHTLSEDQRAQFSGYKDFGGAVGKAFTAARSESGNAGSVSPKDELKALNSRMEQIGELTNPLVRQEIDLNKQAREIQDQKMELRGDYNSPEWRSLDRKQNAIQKKLRDVAAKLAPLNKEHSEAIQRGSELINQIRSQEKSKPAPTPAPAHPFAQSAMKGKIREASGQKMPGEESSSSWYETGKINNYSDDDIRKFYLGRALQTAGKLTAKDFEKGFDSAINSAVSRGDVTDKIANAASAAFDRGRQQAGSKPSPAPSTFTPEMVPGQQASLFGGDDMNTGQKSLFNMVRPTKADQRAARKGEAPSASLLEQIDEEEKKRAESRKSLPGQRDMFSADQIDRFLEQYRAGSGTAKKEKKPKTVTGTYGDRGRFITVGEGEEARRVFLPGSVKKIKETGEYRTDNSQEKAKAARKKAKATGGKKFVPVTKLEKAIVEKIGDHPTDVREFRKIVDRTFSEMNSDAQDRLSAIREIMAFAGYGRNAGAFINQVKAARDYDKIARFDQMAQFAQREYPHVLAPKMKGAGGDVEGALFALLRDGIPEKLAKDSPEVIDAAWDRSDYERMGTPSEWEEEREERQQDDDFVPFSAGRFAITERYSARVSSPGGSFRPRLTQAIR